LKTTKEHLLEEVARSRAAILRDVRTVRAELDYTAKAQQAVRSRPLAWLGGAAALGYIFAGPKTRTVTKHVRGKAQAVAATEEKTKAIGILGALFAFVKFLLPLLRPVLTAYAARRFGDLAEKLPK